MAGLKVSRGHHLATPTEIQDSLNPIPEYLEFTKVAQPADPPSNTRGRVFYNSADNRLSFLRRNDGDTAYEVIDLEGGGGGEVFTWTNNHDADGYNLILDQDGDSAIVGDRDIGIADDEMGIKLFGNIEYVFGTGALDMKNNNLANVDSILMTNGNSIFSISSGVEVRVPDASDDFSIWINGTEEYTWNQTQLAIGTNKLVLTAGHEIFDSGSTLTINSGGGAGQFIHLETNSLGRIQISDTYARLINGISFQANALPVYLDADNDTKWQAGTDDVAQLTIGHATTPKIVISASYTSVVLSDDLTVGGDISGANIVSTSIDAGLIDSGTLAVARIPNLDASKITSGIFGIARGGTGNATNVTGDLLYAPSSNLWSRLGIGGAGEFLKVSGGVPVWSSHGLSLNSLTDVVITSPQAGHILKYNGSAWINQADTGTNEFVDNVFRIIDDIQSTRKLAFQVGGITAGVTRTLTAPNHDGTIITDLGTQSLSGAKTFTTGIVISDASGTMLDLANDATFNLGINFRSHPFEMESLAESNVGAVGTNEGRIFKDSDREGRLMMKTQYTNTEHEFIDVSGHKHGSISTDSINGYLPLQGHTGLSYIGQVQVGNRIQAMPFIPPEDCLLQEIGIRTEPTNAGTADADGIVGVYSNSKSADDGNYPDAKLGQTNAIDMTGGGDVSKEATLQSPVRLKGGELYWLVYHQQDGTVEPDLVEYNGTGMRTDIIPFAPSEFNTGVYIGWYKDSVTYSTTMPSTFPTLATKASSSFDFVAIWCRFTLS